MPMTHEEMIAVIKAHIEGDVIQSRIYGDPNWRNDPIPTFSFGHAEYRAKPRELVAHYRWFYIRKEENIVRITEDHFENPHMAVCSGKLYEVEQILGPCESTKIMRQS